MKPILTCCFALVLLVGQPARAEQSECTQVSELLGATISRATETIGASPTTCHLYEFKDKASWSAECRPYFSKADKLLNKANFYFYMWKENYQCDKTHCIPAVYVGDYDLADIPPAFMCD